MRPSILLWLLLNGVCSAHAQTVTIINEQSGQPVEGAMLISERPQASAVTNAKGQADISIFKEAEAIQIRFIGYQAQTVTYAQMEAAGFQIELRPSSLDLDEVVVSATRWRQSSGNVPAKITVISSEEASLQNPQTAADLLGISGKVFIQKSQQGGGSPMIRGFSTNRLIYTVDGVRMNTAIFRGGNLQNVINLDPFATESTEVLFGPGSVIYGSDAIGGVMSFQTLTPQHSLSGEPLLTGKAVARYSSANNERTGHFDVNVGGKKLASVTSFSAWDYGHLRQGSKGPADYVRGYHPVRQDGQDVVVSQADPLLQIPSAYSQVNLMQKLRFTPDEHWDIQYGFHYSTTSSYGRYDRHNRVRRGTARYAEWDYGPQLWMMNNLAVSHQRRHAAYDQMTLRLAHQSFEESRISRDLNSDLRTRRVENVAAYSTNLDFTKGVGERGTLYYGLEYVLNEVQSRGTDEFVFSSPAKPDSIRIGASRYPQATWRSLAAYLNPSFQVSEQLTLQAGLRYNRFLMDADFSNNQEFYPFPFATAEINEGALTGSLGGVYRLTEQWVVKANFGTAFRSPNVDDIGRVFDSEPGAVVVPNPALRAEYAYNFDLSVARVFGDVVKVDLTGYYTTLQNALVRRDFQLNGQDSILYDGEMSRVQALQNAAFANVYGLQLGIEVKLPAGFALLSDLNYQAGEEEMDDGTTSASRHAAPLFGVSRLRYRHQGLTLEFNAMYQGEIAHAKLAVSEQGKNDIYALDADGNTYAPAWYTLNFRAMYQISQALSLNAGVENLADQRYRPYSSGISAPGRNVVLSVRVGF